MQSQFDKICKFKKFYKNDENEKYNIFVIPIFYYDKYRRLGPKGVYKNKSEERQLAFIRNLKANIENLHNGNIPSNWKFRIYYDKSLTNFEYEGVKVWNKLFSVISKSNKIQLIRFKCSRYYSCKKHCKLFGTLIRFHPLYIKEKNVISVNCIDSDNYMSKKWLDELIKFIDSKYDINVFCSKYEFPRYKDITLKDNFECYFRAGMFSSKISFGEKKWEKAFNDIENPKSNFTKSFNNIIKHLKVFFPDEIQNKDNLYFEFGFDEIFLNYFIKNIIYKKKYKVKYVHYQPSYSIFIDYLLIFLNNKVNHTYTEELLGKHRPPYKTTDHLYNDFKKSIWKHYFFTKLFFLKENIDVLTKMQIDPILLKFITKENKQSCTKYPTFDSYLKTLQNQKSKINFEI